MIEAILETIRILRMPTPQGEKFRYDRLNAITALSAFKRLAEEKNPSTRQAIEIITQEIIHPSQKIGLRDLISIWFKVRGSLNSKRH